MMNLTLRPVRLSDEALLWRCMALAAHEPSAAAVAAIPSAARYVDGWGRPGDFGLVAELDEAPAGAAWARQFTPAERPHVYVDDNTPELVIAVQPEARGRGVGRRLLHALAERARNRHPALCLTVRAENPAIRLYERVGFERLPGADRVNRLGGLSIGMVRRLTVV
jgi:ribosomal protein S18 acetylase RimI-like enzyme